MFSTRPDNCTPFVHIFDIIFLFAVELEEPKIDISVEGLIMMMPDHISLFPDLPIEIGIAVLTHSHTMTPFDAPGKQAF